MIERLDSAEYLSFSDQVSIPFILHGAKGTAVEICVLRKVIECFAWTVEPRGPKVAAIISRPAIRTARTRLIAP